MENETFSFAFVSPYLSPPSLTFLKTMPTCLKSNCYDLKSLEQDRRTTLVLSNIRELDRVPSTKYSTLYTNPHGPC